MGQEVATLVPVSLVQSIGGVESYERVYDFDRTIRDPARGLHTLNGLSAPGSYCCFSNTLVNVETAVLERVFFHNIGGTYTTPYQPSSNEWDLKLHHFRNKLLRILPTVSPMSRKEFVEHYSGRKRKVYDNALMRLEAGAKVDGRITTFIKHEKVQVVEGKRLVPRVISPRKPEYNIEVGCYIRPLEKLIYEGIDKICGDHTVMKGKNAIEQGFAVHHHWSRYRDPVAVGLDASRFDQHVHPAALDWEHNIYKMLTPATDRAKLSQLLRFQMTNTGICRLREGRIKYRVRARRSSGDMNTALGNVLLMCALLQSYIDEKKVNCSFINNGDDSVVFMERSSVASFCVGLKGWFSWMGFVMAEETPVDKIEKVVFCHTQPVWVEGKYRMIRDPRMCLTKDATVLSSVDMNVDYLSQIGYCGLALCSGIPIMQDYYALLGSKEVTSDRIKGMGFWWLSRGLESRSLPVSEKTRVSFYDAFDILPDMQIHLEQQIRSTKVEFFRDDHFNPALVFA